MYAQYHLHSYSLSCTEYHTTFVRTCICVYLYTHRLAAAGCQHADRGHTGALQQNYQGAPSNPFQVPLHLQPSRSLPYLPRPLSDHSRQIRLKGASSESLEERVFESLLRQTDNRQGQTACFCECSQHVCIV